MRPTERAAWRRACAATAAAAFFFAAGVVAEPAADVATLKYVAIVSRHGVRSPTWTPERLREFSAGAWPDFGVPPGNLTAHGRVLMSQMGAYYREWLIAEGLLSAGGCADVSRVYVWADTDERTLETARALAEGVLPGCEPAVHALEAGANDPLFDPIAAGVARPDASAAVRAVDARVGDRAALLAAHALEFATLDRILTGGGAATQTPFRRPAGVEIGVNGDNVELSGPLATASTMGENLLLEYANGFPAASLGWGRLTLANLQQILQLHTVYADIMRRTPYLARARGSNLLAHLLESMRQAVKGTSVGGAIGHPGDSMLIVSGHDTNISNLSGMLGLSWKLPGYPRDDTPPGGALIFSLWQSGTQPFTVKMRYVSQTLDEMRGRTPVSLASPPVFEDLVVPGCASARDECSWEAFSRAAEQAIDPAFVAPW